MLLVENPIFCLIFVLLILIFFLLLFKICNYFETRKSKTKSSPAIKSSETLNKVDNVIEKSKDDKQLVKTQNSEIKVSEENDKSNYYNYLYDRFVTSPTNEDNIQVNDFASTSFLEDKAVEDILNRKININVTPVKKLKNEFGEHNQTSEEKNNMIKQFNSLSKEKKMMIIEDILNHMQ